MRGLVRSLKQDHDLLLATSLAVALAMAEAHALDAVVTDHDLGDNDGRDGVWLLEQVRRRHPEARRILMSGGQAAIDEHIESGLVARFLPEPVGGAEVRAALRTKLCIKCGAGIIDPGGGSKSRYQSRWVMECLRSERSARRPEAARSIPWTSRCKRGFATTPSTGAPRADPRARRHAEPPPRR